MGQREHSGMMLSSVLCDPYPPTRPRRLCVKQHGDAVPCWGCAKELQPVHSCSQQLGLQLRHTSLLFAKRAGEPEVPSKVPNAKACVLGPCCYGCALSGALSPDHRGGGSKEQSSRIGETGFEIVKGPGSSYRLWPE